jgi:hypothetical protein
MKELSVTAENRIGTLANITEALGGAGINIDAISAYEHGGKAVFRVITGDSLSARKALERVQGVRDIAISEVVSIKLENRPGELGKLTRKMANRGIDLETIYIVSKGGQHTEVAIKAVDSHLEKLKALLGVNR